MLGDLVNCVSFQLELVKPIVQDIIPGMNNTLIDIHQMRLRNGLAVPCVRNPFSQNKNTGRDVYLVKRKRVNITVHGMLGTIKRNQKEPVI